MKSLPRLRKAVVLTLLLGSAAGALASHGWREAVPEKAINTEASEGCPIESDDGLSLLFASTRLGGAGLLDIWAADRTAVNRPWQMPRNLGRRVNGPTSDFCPTPIRGRWLLLVSDRAHAGACGGGDIYLTRQSPAGGWQRPEMLDCAPAGPNFSGAERSPSLLETSHGTFLFYSSTGNGGGHDIYVSRLRPNGTFGPGRIVKALDSGFDDIMPNVREGKGGMLELVFSSNRTHWGRRNWPAFGGQDVYVTYARHPVGPWSIPANLGPKVNTAGEETRATLSRDGKRLHFGRDGDIYVSRRSAGR